ncbi:PAS domain S-box protein [Desulfomicrobium salsuginis]
MARKSIAQRMNRDIMVTIAVIAVLFVAMGSIMQLRWKNDNIQSVCRFLDMLVAREQSQMANELFERRYSALGMRVAQIGALDEVLEVVLYDASGKPLVRVAGGAPELSTADVPALDAVRPEPGEPYRFEHDFLALRFTKAVTAAGEVLGWVRISHDLSLLRRQMLSFFTFFFVLLTITLICMLTLLRRRLRQSVVVPLRELGSSMRATDTGSLSRGVSLRQGDLEIANLGEAFEELLARLDRSYRELDEANAALRRSESRLSRAIGASTDAIWEWSYVTGETYYSPRWYEMLGYADQELPMSYETWRSLCHPDDCEQTEREILEAVNSRGLKSYQAEFRMRTRDGGWKWILSRGDVIERDGDGNPVLLSGTHTDISERKQAEERLRQSEEKFFRLFRLSPDTIVLVNEKTGQLVDVNDSFVALSGYSRAEAVGRTFLELGIYRDPAQRDLLYGMLERDGTVRNLEIDVQRKDGSVTPCAVSSQLMQIDGTTHLLAVVRDISQMKQMQELMIQSEKMRSVGGMAAGIAHEINNPLGIILQASHNLVQRMRPDFPKNIEAAGRIGLNMELLERYMRERKLDVFIADIHTAGVRAAEIIRRMLDFSRMSETGRTSCDLRRLIEQSVALAATDYDLRKNHDFGRISVEIEVEEDLPPVACTETEIEQVLLNLLRNASQAMATAVPPTAKPRIRIHASALPEGVRISVEDNGPGMDAEVSRRAFDPFFTTKAPGLGTGLGLSVSYFIVTKSHGGDMRVESEPGKGARFIIDLPSAQEET